MRPHPVGVALLPNEIRLVLRAVRELAEREDSPEAFDVLEQLEHALPVGFVDGLRHERSALAPPVRKRAS